jgi:hypothetical protein
MLFPLSQSFIRLLTTAKMVFELVAMLLQLTQSLLIKKL